MSDQHVYLPQPFKGRAIFGRGTCLRFMAEDVSLFSTWEEAHREADMQAYHVLRAKHGIYADSRGVFVNHLNDLTDEDSRLMEVQYLVWCWNSGIPYGPTAR